MRLVVCFLTNLFLPSFAFLLPNIPNNVYNNAVSNTLFSARNEDASVVTENELYQDVAGQFKILTCSATSCAKKRKDLGMDEFSTFSAFYMRAKENAPSMTVEETSCLGCCKAAPCVAIEHEDYEGPVAVEGMSPVEFSDRVFQNICTEEDADRVWNSVDNAIRILSSEQESEEEEENLGGEGVEV